MLTRALMLTIAIAPLVLATPATAARIHSDDLQDFEDSWRIRWNSNAEARQEDGSVLLLSERNSRRNRVLGKEYISTRGLTELVFDQELMHGGYRLTAVRFATVNGRTTRLGMVSLGRNPGDIVDLSGFDWEGADEIRLRLVLDEGTELRLRRVDVHASAAPEPSAALLLGIGFLIAGAHARNRDPR